MEGNVSNFGVFFLTVIEMCQFLECVNPNNRHSLSTFCYLRIVMTLFSKMKILAQRYVPGMSIYPTNT